VAPLVGAAGRPAERAARGTTVEIVELAATFTLTRQGGVASGPLSTVPGMRSATTQLSPTGAATTTGLAAFAQSFEAALAGEAARYKVAYGPDRESGAAATSATLWAVPPPIATAAAAIGAVNTMLEHVVGPPDARHALIAPRRRRRVTGTSGDAYAFTVREDAEPVLGQDSVLVITVAVASGPPR
jgi:hypothetical protein